MTLPLMPVDTKPVWAFQTPGLGDTLASGIQQFGQNYLTAQAMAAKKEQEQRQQQDQEQLALFLRALLGIGVAGETLQRPSQANGVSIPGAALPPAGMGLPQSIDPQGRAQFGATQPIVADTPSQVPQPGDLRSSGPIVPSTGTDPAARQRPQPGAAPVPGAPDGFGMTERFWTALRGLDPRLVPQAFQLATPILAQERERQAALAKRNIEQIVNEFLPAIRSGQMTPGEALQKVPPEMRDDAEKMFNEQAKALLDEQRAASTDDITGFRFHLKARGIDPEAPPAGFDMAAEFDKFRLARPAASAARTTINLPAGQKQAVEARGKGLGEQDVEARAEALDVIKRAPSRMRQMQAVEGAITGPGAEQRLYVARLLKLDPEAVKDTELYKIEVGNSVLQNTRALGTGNGFSNTDREFLERISGGDISFSKPGLRQISRLLLQNDMVSLREYIQEYESLAATNPGEGYERYVTPRMKSTLAEMERAFAKAIFDDPSYDEAFYGPSGGGDNPGVTTVNGMEFREPR